MNFSGQSVTVYIGSLHKHIPITTPFLLTLIFTPQSGQTNLCVTDSARVLVGEGLLTGQFGKVL